MGCEKTSLRIKGTPLIKIQSADRIQSLRQGHLFGKTLNYYRELEKETGDDEIGDVFEAMLHVNEGYVRFPESGNVISLNDVLIPTIDSDAFVFCMFGIYPALQSFTFTEKQKEKLLSFGDTALVVLDSDEFINRVKLAAENAGYDVHFRGVQYFDPTVDNGNLIVSLLSGIWNVAFWKRDKYTYQQEARFLFTPGNGEDHINLDIGDISDITAVFPTRQVLTASVTKDN